MKRDAVIADFTYTYDAQGNRLTKTNDQGLHEYGYDKLNRLVTAKSAPDGNSTYVYDAVGNRMSLTKDGHATTNTFDADNRQLTSNGVTFGYDSNGNQTQKGEEHHRRTNYVFDFRNRLTAVIGMGEKVKEDGHEREDNHRGKSGEFHGEGKDEGHGRDDDHDGEEDDDKLGRRRGVTFEAGYAPDGSRVFKSENGDTTFFVYDLEDIIAEIDSIGQIKRRITHGPGIDEPLSITDIATGKTHYLHYDALGSVVSVTDAAQAIAERYHYDAFGNRLEASALGISYSFTAREWDAGAALYYYRSRQYDPTRGRFTRKDKFVGFFIRPTSLHKFNYIENNPIILNDPYGFCSGYWFDLKNDLLALPDNTHYVCLSIIGSAYASTTGGLNCVAATPTTIHALKEALNGTGPSSALISEIQTHLQNSNVIKDVENNLKSISQSTATSLGCGSGVFKDISSNLPAALDFSSDPNLSLVIKNVSVKIGPGAGMSKINLDAFQSCSGSGAIRTANWKYNFSGTIKIHDRYNFDWLPPGPGSLGKGLEKDKCLTPYDIDVEVSVKGSDKGSFCKIVWP